MSDTSQNQRPDGFPLGDEWEQEMLCESLSAPTYYPEIESDIIADTHEMLQSVATAVETISQPADGMQEHVAATIAALGELTPSDADDPTEGFRACPESAFNQTPAILVSLLDQFTEAWGYGDRAPFQANEQQRLRYLIVAKMLGHLEERFGLAPTSVDVGREVDDETMRVLDKLPAEREGQVPGKVARLVHMGFRHNDGVLWRRADVIQFISPQEDAARYALEHYHGLLIR